MKKINIVIAIFSVFFCVQCTNNNQANSESSNTEKELQKNKDYDRNKGVQNHFKIPVNQDTTLKCKGGTTIKIKKNSFDCDEKSMIELKVLEVYSKSDLILNNLHTISNKGLLETGGMINIEAYSLDGNTKKLVELKEGKKIGVSFKKEMDQGVLFNLVPSTDRKTKNWVEDTSALVKVPIQGYGHDEKGQIVDTFLVGYNVVSNYFTASKLGWLNYDRYLKKDDSLTKLVCKAKTGSLPSNATCYIVFKDKDVFAKGIVSPSNDSFTFNQMPSNEKVGLLVFVRDKNKSVRYKINDISISDEHSINFAELKESSLKEFEREIESRFGKEI